MSDIPDLKSVESSNLSHVGHDGKDLYVRFKNGGTYKYADVPPEAHDALMNADSKGTHIAKNIVGKYTHTKLDVK